MSINKDSIIYLPHDSLRQRSVKVGFINEEIKQIIEDMKLATIDWENSREHEVGVALAAVQIDKLYRIVVIREDFNDKNNTNFDVFINPKIVKYEGEVEEDFEGCLSVKDLYGKVPRNTRVRVDALDENGKAIRVKAEGFLARVFQHEIDHTNGKLFVDHIKDDPDAFFKLSPNGKIEEIPDEEKQDIFSILW
jgi:peptide deformylase